MAASLVLLASCPAAALDQVSLQLKWKHQFQFAGYYAALEQGFYRAANLDVSIREGGPGIDVAETVANGKSDFGVCSSSVLRERTVGRQLVVLAAIFQRSPAVILVARRADISSVSDLRGRTLTDAPGSDEIAAMLKREGVDYEALPRVAHEGNPRDLLAGRADAHIAVVAAKAINPPDQQCVALTEHVEQPFGGLFHFQAGGPCRLLARNGHGGAA
jgi:ABC-type nitrate/sulfonate/bicarbonate transport system substrate-binding protein